MPLDYWKVFGPYSLYIYIYVHTYIHTYVVRTLGHSLPLYSVPKYNKKANERKEVLQMQKAA